MHITQAYEYLRSRHVRAPSVHSDTVLHVWLGRLLVAGLWVRTRLSFVWYHLTSTVLTAYQQWVHQPAQHHTKGPRTAAAGYVAGFATGVRINHFLDS
eukprot:2887400-Pyramimonas_sp.AAC.1